MQGALIILAVTALIGLTLYLIYGRRRTPDATPAEPDAAPAADTDDACCGQHLVCEKQSLQALSPEAEYFDDEELDRFRGRAPQQYTPEETEEFRDVLLTLRPDEVAAWGRAMTVRGIELPTEVRDELLMIVSEMRNT